MYFIDKLCFCVWLFCTVNGFASPIYAPSEQRGAGSQAPVLFHYNSMGHRLNAASVSSIQVGLLGKPVSFNTVGGEVINFRYGPKSHRYLRTDSDGTKLIYLNNRDTLYQVKDGNVTVRHVIKTDNYSPVAQVMLPKNASPTYFYYIKDHLGSPRIAIHGSDGSGDKSNFDAWGQSVDSNGSSQTMNGEYPSFTGHEAMAAAKLVHMNARLYDPHTSQFLAPDPVLVKTHLSRYAYVQANPLNATDPSGLTPITTKELQQITSELPIPIEVHPTIVRFAKRLNEYEAYKRSEAELAEVLSRRPVMQNEFSSVFQQALNYRETAQRVEISARGVFHHAYYKLIGKLQEFNNLTEGDHRIHEARSQIKDAENLLAGTRQALTVAQENHLIAGRNVKEIVREHAIQTNDLETRITHARTRFFRAKNVHQRGDLNHVLEHAAAAARARANRLHINLRLE